MSCNVKPVYDLGGWGEIRTRETELTVHTLSRRRAFPEHTRKACALFGFTPHAKSAASDDTSIVWPERPVVRRTVYARRVNRATHDADDAYFVARDWLVFCAVECAVAILALLGMAGLR